MLSGHEIRRQRDLGQIVITPWDEGRVNPNSYDLSLADELFTFLDGGTHREYLDTELDFKMHPRYTLPLVIPPEGFVLRPGVLYLGSTIEWTETYGFVPVLHGKSSVGRLGVQVHVTAGFGDDGFRGHWTLEITAVQRVRIYAGIPVCQITYCPVVGERMVYDGHYQDQKGAVPGAMWKDLTADDKLPTCWMCKKPVRGKVYYQGGHRDFPAHENCTLSIGPAGDNGGI